MNEPLPIKGIWYLRKEKEPIFSELYLVFLSNNSYDVFDYNIESGWIDEDDDQMVIAWMDFPEFIHQKLKTSDESFKMPFGKYQGMPLLNLPIEYICWVLEHGKHRMEKKLQVELENILKSNGKRANDENEHRKYR